MAAGSDSKAAPRPVMRPHGPGMAMGTDKPRDPRNALLRLFPYLSAFRWPLSVVFLFVGLSTLLGLLVPYLTGVAIDRFISAGNLAGLGRIALIMLAIFLVSNIIQAAANWIMGSISQRALKQLRSDLFSHMQELPVSFFDGQTAGNLMSRLTNDIEAVNQAVSQNVIGLFASVLSMVGILVAMFTLNWHLALVSLLVVPLMFWFTEFVARYTRKGFRELQSHLGQLNGVMEESISGQRVIKAFRRNASVIESFRRDNAAVYKAAVYANSYAFLMMPITGVLGNLFVILLAAFGGWLALRGVVTVGTIAAFIGYSQGFLNPLRQIAFMYNSVQAALAGAERVFEILDTQPEPADPPDAVPLVELQGDVALEKVRFSYVPGTSVINDMSLVARAGETTALVGPTGAGKTTIANLLTRFYDIDSGTIRIDGHDIRRIRRNDLRRQLGLVLQDTFMFSDTVMENIRYGRLEATDNEVIAAAKLADADHFILHLPDGYQTVLAERAGNLSQGQRQLLSIARAILADPGILILDEATSSVDTRTELRIQQSLLRLMEGRTSFVIAHRLSTIRDADQVVVIDRGGIVERGTHQELLDRRGFYHQLYVSQFRGEEI